MTGYRARRTTVAALTAAVATVAVALAGCSDDNSPSSVASRAESAARSVGGEATAAASSLASEIASATAEAGRRIDDIKGGVDVKDDVTLGDPDTAGDGRTTVRVTVDNTTDSAKSFVVQVNFTDQGGKLLDVVLVTVSDAPADGSGQATARSNRKLTGTVKAEVARAVRY